MSYVPCPWGYLQAYGDKVHLTLNGEAPMRYLARLIALLLALTGIAFVRPAATSGPAQAKD